MNEEVKPPNNSDSAASYGSGALPIKRAYFEYPETHTASREPTMIVGECDRGHRGLIWIDPCTGKPVSAKVKNCLRCRINVGS